jgi:hypothetical protein
MVARAVVSTCAAGPGDARLVAHVLRRDGLFPSPRELREHLARSLPGYMVPAAYVAIPALPLTRSGKVDHHRLPPPAKADWVREAEVVAPSTPSEERIAAVWTALLDSSGWGVRDDFFAAGGHSLLAAQLASRVGQAFGIELPLQAVFERSTIAQLAEYVDAVLVAAEPGAAAGGAQVEEERL